MDKKITIERTVPNKGYESEDYSIADALNILNIELENKRTIFIDGKHFNGDVVMESDISNCKREVSVVNQLIGG